MKLKLLLIPFAVLMSLILVIWYIYPSLFGDDPNSIKNIRKEVSKIEGDIANIKNKKSNINKLTQAIESGGSLGDVVLNYYSNTRRDEDVINNLNNIAFNEGIYLDDIDLKYLKVDKSDDPVKVMSLKKIEALTPATLSGGVTDIANQSQADLDIQTQELNGSRINYISVALKGSGDYSQIRNFLISVNKIGLLNKVQSFKIYKDVVGKENESSDPNKLKFDLTIGFGYFKESKEPVVNLLNSPVLGLNDFDLSEIEKSKDILTGNYQKSEIGETGLINPFIP